MISCFPLILVVFGLFTGSGQCMATDEDTVELPSKRLFSSRTGSPDQRNVLRRIENVPQEKTKTPPLRRRHTVSGCFDSGYTTPEKPFMFPTSLHNPVSAGSEMTPHFHPETLPSNPRSKMQRDDQFSEGNIYRGMSPPCPFADIHQRTNQAPVPRYADYRYYLRQTLSQEAFWAFIPPDNQSSYLDHVLSQPDWFTKVLSCEQQYRYRAHQQSHEVWYKAQIAFQNQNYYGFPGAPYFL